MVDAKGYMVDVKGYMVDAKGYRVDSKGWHPMASGAHAGELEGEGIFQEALDVRVAVRLG
eukprot:8582611-Pyramimonas_sp.AAC.2